MAVEDSVQMIIQAIAEGRSLESTEPAAIPENNDPLQKSLAANLRTLSLIEAYFRAESTTLQGRDLDEDDDRTQLCAGDRFGHLRIEAVIGRGTSSIVYRAWDEELHRRVALKVFVDDACTTEHLREGQALASVRHPSLVTVFGAARIDNVAGLWMEYIDGFTLEESLASKGPLSAREATFVGADVCGALAALHAAGLVHRDVKAANVMREVGGRIVLMDLGSSGSLQAAVKDIGGTPMYMAPELFADQPASPQSDIYAVGVLMFRLLTSRYPLEATSIDALIDAHRGGRRQLLNEARSGIPPAVVAVVNRAIAERPDERFRSAGQLEEALNAALGHRSSDISARGADARPESGLMGRRIPLWAALVACLILVSATAAVTWLGTFSANTSVHFDGGGYRKPYEMPEDLRQLLEGYENLGLESAERGDWTSAATTFSTMLDLTLQRIGVYSPLRSTAHARRGWALQHLGRLEEAKDDYEAALYNFSQELGPINPWAANIHTALAAIHQQLGQYDAAAESFARALSTRQRLLGLTGAEFPTRPELEASLRKHSAIDDSDVDWISDAAEAALGLDPQRIDSDNDGTPDAEELLGPASWPAALAWGVNGELGHVTAFVAAAHPTAFGFRSTMSIDREEWRSTSRYASLKLATTTQGQYFYRLPRITAEVADRRGWRYTYIGNASGGIAGAVLDRGPNFKRYDLNEVFQRDGSVIRGGSTGVIPLAMTAAHQLPSAPPGPPLEMRFDPRSGTAGIFDNGRRVTLAYTGHTQFRYQTGVNFGLATNTGDRGPGAAEFVLVVFEVHK